MPIPIEHIFIDGIESKKCSICHDMLPVSSFWKHKNRHDGLQSACKACVLQWKQTNKDAVNAANRRSKRNNKAANDAINRRYQKEKYKTDISYRLRTIMSVNVNQAIRGKKKGRGWASLVGYDVGTLKKHLEKRFLPGMSWENYGEWQIDHIIPVTAFNIDSYECLDFKRCWALKNLRPLWKIDNILKYNRLEKPFQPSLALEIREQRSVLL